MSLTMHYSTQEDQVLLYPAGNIVRSRASMIGLMYKQSLSEIVRKNVIAFRDKFGWSTNELARQSKISTRMAAKVVNGESAPTTNTIEKLARAFGVEAWELMLPNAHPDQLLGSHISDVQAVYIVADKEGRELMEAAAKHVAAHRQTGSNDSADTEKKQA